MEGEEMDEEEEVKAKVLMVWNELRAGHKQANKAILQKSTSFAFSSSFPSPQSNHPLMFCSVTQFPNARM